MIEPFAYFNSWHPFYFPIVYRGRFRYLFFRMQRATRLVNNLIEELILELNIIFSILWSKETLKNLLIWHSHININIFLVLLVVIKCTPLIPCITHSPLLPLLIIWLDRRNNLFLYLLTVTTHLFFLHFSTLSTTLPTTLYPSPPLLIQLLQ